MPNSMHEFCGKSFVGCPSRLGTITRTGPITGKEYVVPATGIWIDAEDAAALSEIIEDIFCPRVNQTIPTYAVFYLSPTANQVAELKEKMK